MKTIVLLGTLDTKGREIAFLSERARTLGFSPLVIDVGILGDPQSPADISRHTVAETAGTTIDELIKLGDKMKAIETMVKGATLCAQQLFSQGKLDGIMAIGGAQGTYLGAKVMQGLPFGVPKVIVSAIANGNTRFGPITGTKDITVIHSVADILGLNRITRSVLADGLASVTGMIIYGSEEERGGKKTIALSAAGVTTISAMMVLENLEKMGYEVITFHCSGTAAKAMEELALEGQLDGICDLSPHNLTDLVAGGIMPAEEERLEFLSEVSIPYVIAPGCADLVLGGELDTLPKEWLERKYYQHNQFHTHVRANYREMYAVGEFVGEHFQKALGKAAVVIPLKGFSQANIEGGLIFEPESDRGFLDGVYANVPIEASEKIRVYR